MDNFRTHFGRFWYGNTRLPERSERASEAIQKPGDFKKTLKSLRASRSIAKTVFFRGRVPFFVFFVSLRVCFFLRFLVALGSLWLSFCRCFAHFFRVLFEVRIKVSPKMMFDCSLAAANPREPRFSLRKTQVRVCQGFSGSTALLLPKSVQTEACFQTFGIFLVLFSMCFSDVFFGAVFLSF